MTTLRLQTLVLIAVLAPVAACVADTTSDDGDPAFADDSKADGSTSGFRVCATQHTGSNADGDAVVFCDQMFDTQPRVALPRDYRRTGTSTSTIYAALDLAGQITAIDRHGARYTLVDASGNAIDETKLPAQFRMPSHRALFTLYKLRAIITTYTDPYTKQDVPALQVTGGKPLLVIEGKAIDGAYMTPTFALEGTVSARTGTTFDSSHPVPIRITFQTLEAWANMPTWSSGTLKDGTRSKVVGTIDNWSSSVMASDGTCMTSFASLGAANPWQGATDPTVRFYRYPGMHFPADEVHVLDYPAGTANLSMNGMGGMTATHPAAFIQVQPNADWSTIEVFPHSAPNGHQMQLHVVSGGGGACS